VPEIDTETLVKHGIKTAAFQVGGLGGSWGLRLLAQLLRLLSACLHTLCQGEEMPIWLQRYTAEVLRFIEFERRVLPYKFMEPMPDGGLRR
jgi:hypothetical protein